MMVPWMLAVVLTSGILVENTFDRPDGPLPDAWRATRSGWGVASGRVHPPAVRSTSEAVRKVGRSAGLTVAADVRLSATPRRANAGLAFMWRGHRNHFFCKAEVTEGNPAGLLTIGRALDGRVTSLLAARRDVGLVNGETYRMRMRRRGPVVSCTLARGGLPRQVTVSHVMTALERERLGPARKAGFRVKVEADEDDGGSRFDDFVARR